MITQFCEYTKTTELYALSGCIIWYVNYIKFILYENKQKQKFPQCLLLFGLS